MKLDRRQKYGQSLFTFAAKKWNEAIMRQSLHRYRNKYPQILRTGNVTIISRAAGVKWSQTPTHGAHSMR